jgi:hypothetical protein
MGIGREVARPGSAWPKPVFRSLRRLAESYFEGFIDRTGCLRAYGMVDLRVLGTYDWRLAPGNIWKVERLLFDIPHRPIRSSARASHACVPATWPPSLPSRIGSRCTTTNATGRKSRAHSGTDENHEAHEEHEGVKDSNVGDALPAGSGGPLRRA